MIWSFVLAVALAIMSFFFGGYVVQIAIYSRLTLLAVVAVVIWSVYWLYRRVTRGRRGGVRQIPRL